MKIILIRAFFYLALLVYVASTKKEAPKKDHQPNNTTISTKGGSREPRVGSQESIVGSQESTVLISPLFISIYKEAF
jgi:hypothetical protein